MPRSWGELHLPPEHYLIVYLQSSDPRGRKTEGQSAAPASDELARFVLGDEQFCIVRAVGLEGASLVALGRLNKQIAAQLISDLELPGGSRSVSSRPVPVSGRRASSRYSPGLKMTGTIRVGCSPSRSVRIAGLRSGSWRRVFAATPPIQ
jgi:hypothetical protein